MALDLRTDPEDSARLQPVNADELPLDRLNTTQSAEAVLGCLKRAISKLHAGGVAAVQLVERNRVSKRLDGYTQNTQNVAALRRARDQDLAVHLGQDIEYVVVDDEKTSRERVALAHEEIETYDASYYEPNSPELLRVCCNCSDGPNGDQRELAALEDATLS